jgi:hypothetical protein
VELGLSPGTWFILGAEAKNGLGDRPPFEPKVATPIDTYRQ